MKIKFQYKHYRSSNDVSIVVTATVKGHAYSEREVITLNNIAFRHVAKQEYKELKHRILVKIVESGDMDSELLSYLIMLVSNKEVLEFKKDLMFKLQRTRK